jgi:hypothetical protein
MNLRVHIDKIMSAATGSSKLFFVEKSCSSYKLERRGKEKEMVK